MGVQKENDARELRTPRADAQERDRLQIFGGGLPFGVEKATLGKEFSKCGPIAQMTMPSDGEGNSKGIAFITYETEAAVLNALKKDGQEYRSRTIKVNRAGGFSQQNHKVFVKGLPYEPTEAQLKTHFG